MEENFDDPKLNSQAEAIYKLHMLMPLVCVMTSLLIAQLAGTLETNAILPLYNIKFPCFFVCITFWFSGILGLLIPMNKWHLYAISHLYVIVFALSVFAGFIKTC